MLSTDILNPTSEQKIILLTASSDWVEKKKSQKITKYLVDFGELTAMVTVTKIDVGQCTRGYVLSNDFNVKMNFRHLESKH